MQKFKNIVSLFLGLIMVFGLSCGAHADPISIAKQPLIVTDTLGNKVAVWISMEGLEHHVLASTSTERESWSEPKNISRKFDHYPRHLKVYKNSNDGILAVWIDRHPITKENCLCASIFDSANSTWDTSMVASAADSFDLMNYSVSLDDSNNIDIIWSGNTTLPKAVVRHSQSKFGLGSWSQPEILPSL